MASPISCLSILIIPLLVTSLFYNVSNADQPLLEKVCKKTMDHDFCMSVLLSDQDGLTNVLYTLGLASTSVSLKIISDFSGEIENVLIGVTNPVDRTRILNCITNTYDIYEKMQLARNVAGTQSYVEKASLLTVAQQKITKCNNQFESPQQHVSPISNHTSKLTKLINISSVIISMITSS